MDTSKLLWVDLEMTGLDPAKDRIVEVAVVITDYKYKVLAEYESGIALPAEEVDTLFSKSPFWQASPEALAKMRKDMANGKPDKQVRQEVLALISEHFSEPAILSGNSIHQDRRFIRQWWPEIDAKLHYRMLDVSSYKIITEQRGFTYEKKGNHRALSDIYESIEELKYCLDILASDNRRNNV